MEREKQFYGEDLNEEQLQTMLNFADDRVIIHEKPENEEEETSDEGRDEADMPSDSCGNLKRSE